MTITMHQLYEFDLVLAINAMPIMLRDNDAEFLQPRADRTLVAAQDGCDGGNIVFRIRHLNDALIFLLGR